MSEGKGRFTVGDTVSVSGRVISVDRKGNALLTGTTGWEVWVAPRDVSVAAEYRAHIAAAALQGLLASGHNGFGSHTKFSPAREALRLADALIAALDAKEPGNG